LLADPEPAAAPQETAIQLSDALAALSGDHAANAAVSDGFTASEGAEILAAIRPCWKIDGGAIGAADLVVALQLTMDRDGNVIEARAEDGSGIRDVTNWGELSSISPQEVALARAKQAVVNSDCNPLPMPADKFEQWKTWTLEFNPKDMF
jgi:hypothetical protein